MHRSIREIKNDKDNVTNWVKLFDWHFSILSKPLKKISKNPKGIAIL